MGKRILGIVGSYRKNGTIDTLVSEVCRLPKDRELRRGRSTFSINGLSFARIAGPARKSKGPSRADAFIVMTWPASWNDTMPPMGS